jgi:outer membrane protein assembly factor BamB
MRSRVFGFALLFVGSAALAADWTGFRGPGGTGVAPDDKVPSEWDKEKNVAWKAELPGVAWSSPIVVGDKVFVTTAVTDKQKKPTPGGGGFGKGGGGGGGFGKGGGFGGGKPPDAVYKFEVLCLNRADGKILWTKTAAEKKPLIAAGMGNSYATETPVSDGKRVFAYFGPHGLFCYDLDGKKLWDKDLGAYQMKMGYGTGSSPALDGERLYIQCDNEEKSFLLCLNAKDGEEVWKKTRTERSSYATPMVWKNKVRTELVCLASSRIRSYDPANGDVLWEMSWTTSGGGKGGPGGGKGPGGGGGFGGMGGMGGMGGYGAASPAANDEIICFGSGGPFGSSPLYAVKAGAKGDISLKGDATSSESVLWSVKGAAPVLSSPLLYDGHIYVFDQRGGMVSCYDAKTGKAAYSKERLPKARGFTSSPWAADGKVYCLDDSGQTFVIKAGPEFKLLATNPINEMFWSSPAVAGGQLFLRGAEHLYCIKK